MAYDSWFRFDLSDPHCIAITMQDRDSHFFLSLFFLRVLNHSHWESKSTCRYQTYYAGGELNQPLGLHDFVILTALTQPHVLFLSTYRLFERRC